MTLIGDRARSAADTLSARRSDRGVDHLRRIWWERLRRHRLITAVVVVAVVVRVLVAVAYAPALEFFGDSYDYLRASTRLTSVDMWHPFGYPLVLWVFSLTHSLAVLTAVQHVLGVVTGVVIYRLVRELDVGSVGGTLAATPVLLDAYQIDVEQIVLSETLFTLLLVLVLRRCVRMHQRPSSAAVGLGLLLAALTLTRTVGIVVAAAVLAWLLVTRVGWRRVAVAAAVLAVPLLGYALAFRATYGVLALQGYGGRYLYGSVAPFVDCSTLSVPTSQRVLCPDVPPDARPGFNQYVWSTPAFGHLHGSDVVRSQLAGQFARRALLHQPTAFAGEVVGNFGHYFAPGRPTGPRDWFVGSWQFPLASTSPAWHIEPALIDYGGGRLAQGARVVPSLATVLRGYQRVVYTPGPLMLLLVILVAVATVRRPRDRRVWVAALFAGTGLLLLFVPSVTAGFDWRYLLPAQAVLVPGGVVAADVLRRELSGRTWARHAQRGGVLVALVSVAVGVAPSSVYAAGDLRPHDVRPAPATADLGGRLRVQVAAPHIVDTPCVRTGHGLRAVGVVAFPVTVTWQRGSRALVQPANFTVAHQPAGPHLPASAKRDREVLPTVVVGPDYRQAAGMVFMTSLRGRLDYVDPNGAGAAAWTFDVPASERDTLRTVRCPSTSSAAVLTALHINGVSPFTEATSAHISYGLQRAPSRAKSYDLRWRAVTPGQPAGQWEYPKIWQRTTRTSQSLLDLVPGTTYCLSVRARDALGAVGGWTPETCTTRLYDDTSLATSSGWSRNSGQSGFYQGTYTVATRRGATLGVAGDYSRVAVALYRCPTCGAVAVYSGRSLVGRVSLASTTGQQGLFTWVSPPLPQPTQRIAIQVASQDRLVAVDGVGLTPVLPPA